MKRTININKNLDQKVREEMEKNDTTYTFIVNIALNNYFELQGIKTKFEKTLLNRLENLQLTENENS